MIQRRVLPTLPIALVVLAAGALTVLPATSAHAADTNCPAADASYAGGTGTSGDPLLVSTPGQLQRLRDQSADWSKAIRLTADIDMSSGGTDCTWGSTLGNPNIANWTGTFDGDGHIVSGLDIEVTGNFVGFFGYLSNGAVVRDFGFTGDVSATASGAGSVQAGVGGLTGWTLSSQILRSFTTGDVTVNISASADINTDSATAVPIVGGLVGNSQGTVANSYATGAVHVTASAGAINSGTASVVSSVGGLFGSSTAGASIVSNSYSTGTVTTSPSATGGIGQSISERIGGSIGDFSTQYASATGVVWDTTASGRVTGLGSGTSAGVTGQTSSQMTTYSTFTNLNWNIADGYGANSTWSLCPALNGGKPVLSRFATNATCYPPPPPPPPPAPSSEPLSVVATAGDRSAEVAWSAPASSGSFPVSHYQVTSSPGSRTCLVAAPVLACSIDGLTNGTAYTFRVKALTGAGWSGESAASHVVVPRASAGPSIVISGTRDGKRIKVSGSTTGFGMGATLNPWVRLAGQSSYAQGASQVLVSMDGTFEWGRTTGKKVFVYMQTPDESVRSNTVAIR